MSEKPYIYCLLIEVDQARGQPYLDWLLDGHIEEVVKNPGFLSGSMTRFDELAADGWARYMVTYEVTSRETLEVYWKGDVFKSYTDKAKEFAGTFRITRVSGETILSFG